MADRTAPETLNVRLPLYAYTGALWRGRRVLEIGCGDGSSAAYLAMQGAADVVSLDLDAARIERARTEHARPGIHYLLLDSLQQLAALAHRFDIVFLPEGEIILSDPELAARIRSLMRDDGFLIVSVAASERQSAFFRGGVGYYDLSDALTRDFEAVRMLGQTPFLGFGLIEFDGASEGLRVDVSLLGGGAEQPSHYVAIAGGALPPPLGQALVQVPFAPIEALAEATDTEQSHALVARPIEVALAEAEREIDRLRAEVAEGRLGGASAGHSVELVAAATRADLAERRLDEAERRARARADEADTRFAELRRKLEDALIQSESAVRVSRAQADEIEELRGRLRRAAEDRALGDAEVGKLRRALAEADDSVLTLTRRTAEEMAVVAQRLVTGLGSGAAAGGGGGVAVAPVAPGVAAPELEAKLRRAEETIARSEAEVATLSARLRAADDELRGLKRQAGEIATRDDRIARLEGDKQDLLWRVAELEEKLRNAEQDATAGRAPPEEIARARASRDRAIEEFHRGAAAHVNEVNRLQASVSEHAALVAELEDALRAAEARAAAADKEATTLRRNAKELEESDRARRGRLSELEGKLLRVERERAMAVAATAAAPPLTTLRGDGGGGDGSDLAAKLVASARRADALEQRALAAEEALRAERLHAATAAQPSAQEAMAAAERVAAAEARVVAAEARATVAEARAASAPKNGAYASALPSNEVRAVIEGAEARLRDEVRALGRIEETLGRAEEIVARTPSAAEQAERERAAAARDAQIVEGRLELARVRRDAETARLHLENEIADLRAKLGAPAGEGGGSAADQSMSTQLILMHSTLGNIRRRAARLRDELEGFRRRIDTLPPGALSSMLEEIGDDLGEFAK